ncbi:MAG: hypothetical protein AAFW75_27845, partial [Cyanobacteria bacterium J06636_16]
AVLQEDFSITGLNLLLVFQVNCPGCFLYALPLANELFKEHRSQGLNVLGLSTAFEDFHLNTLDNTRLLLEESRFVGVTQQVLRANGLESAAMDIPFSVAFDHVGRGDRVLTEADIDIIYQSYSLSLNWPKEKHAVGRDRLQNHLFSQPLLAYTFTLNQLRGTPSWILFDDELNILAQWFGHQPKPAVENLIAEVRQKKFLKVENSRK